MTEKRAIETHYFDRSDMLGVVVETIHPGSHGRVEFQGTYWQSKSTHNVELPRNSQVYVVGVEGNKLLVEPIQVEVGTGLARKGFAEAARDIPRAFISKMLKIIEYSLSEDIDIYKTVTGKVVSQTIQPYTDDEILGSIASNFDKIDAQIEEYQIITSQLKEDTRKELSQLEEVVGQL